MTFLFRSADSRLASRLSLQAAPSQIAATPAEMQSVDAGQTAKVIPFYRQGSVQLVGGAIAEAPTVSPVSIAERMAWKKQALASREYARILRRGGSLSL